MLGMGRSRFIPSVVANFSEVGFRKHQICFVLHRISRQVAHDRNNSTTTVGGKEGLGSSERQRSTHETCV